MSRVVHSLTGSLALTHASFADVDVAVTARSTEPPTAYVTFAGGLMLLSWDMTPHEFARHLRALAQRVDKAYDDFLVANGAGQPGDAATRIAESLSEGGAS